MSCDLNLRWISGGLLVFMHMAFAKGEFLSCGVSGTRGIRRLSA